MNASMRSFCRFKLKERPAPGPMSPGAGRDPSLFVGTDAKA